MGMAKVSVRRQEGNNEDGPKDDDGPKNENAL